MAIGNFLTDWSVLTDKSVLKNQSFLTDWIFLTDWSVLTDQFFCERSECLDILEYIDSKYPINHFLESYGVGGWCIWIIASALVLFEIHYEFWVSLWDVWTFSLARDPSLTIVMIWNDLPLPNSIHVLLWFWWRQ